MNKEISVIMLTYNHAPYLRQAIEGVLSQKTDFPIELIICNDNSPDDSDTVIAEYAARFPDTIRYFKHQKNIGFVENQRFAFTQAKGKYLAYCEGDDYWTDPEKLQFQHDFLEANPEYVMVTARNLLLHQEENKLTDDGKDLMYKDQSFIDFTQDSFFVQRPTQTFTYLIRKKFMDMKWIDVYPNYRDLYYFYHLLEFGKGRSFNKVIGVYRLHSGGVFSSLEFEKQYRTSIDIFKNIKRVNHDKRADQQILTTLDQLINKYYYEKEFVSPIFNRKLYAAIAERFSISGNASKGIIQLLKIIKYTFTR
ncbi:glycosyltransferase [Chryseobacterium sp. Tr-659]|uniref:glycosyltransferase family 2 protein n=1 Tax=Chryseobacterium sp. Tr-659 TaxID=2608340 RepID=UPI0014233C0D|nr:glycosyltransferase [Chryseobacterium sp. Tr-659]NIF05486.1 glycosyltransferase [Chryseobacterium sp. Tr-659]